MDQFFIWFVDFAPFLSLGDLAVALSHRQDIQEGGPAEIKSVLPFFKTFYILKSTEKSIYNVCFRGIKDQLDQERFLITLAQKI